MKREKFWTFTVGNLISLISVVCTALVSYGKLSEIIKEHEEKIKGIQISLEVVVNKIPEMNEKLATQANDIRWIRSMIGKENRAVGSNDEHGIASLTSNTAR